MLKISSLTLWTLTFGKDFGTVLSYCHTGILCKDERVKSSHSQQAYKEGGKKKKTACMPYSITGKHLCSFSRTILLPFGLHNSQKYPQHPLVASKRKSTKQNIPCKRKKKKACKVAISSNKQTTITNPSVHSGLVLLKTRNWERERGINQVSPP